MDFSTFQKAINEDNKTILSALECTVFILRRAQELPVDQRLSMVEIVRGLISMKDKNGFLSSD